MTQRTENFFSFGHKCVSLFPGTEAHSLSHLCDGCSLCAGCRLQQGFCSSCHSLQGSILMQVLYQLSRRGSPLSISTIQKPGEGTFLRREEPVQRPGAAA
ncbi:unnamed protein product [Rangifer tarandus platyrhynchus]|uniref:Uncharacterized protein n=2 Tax=Rangifer tarandus platyrhynchus TaxID=3082113 RepID=A0ABN8YE49_RANTA|nr:unnamed protein product [Rangifer tarandus platyrhynchus]